jgi:hypothetical protein
MFSLRLVPYGPSAARALRDAVLAAKGDDPLAPVTVAVPSNYAGLSLRRRLGAGDLSLAPLTGREGLVNVRFLVFARVAELLGAPSLAARGLRPLTAPVRGEAVRAALSADPGPFGDVAQHGATERSLEWTFRDLAQAPDAALEAVARQSARAAHIVRLYRLFRESTTGYYDEEQLALAAAEAVRAKTPALRDVGHVILCLPRRLSRGERALAESLAEAHLLSALIGVTGDPGADAPAQQIATHLGRALGPADAPARDPEPPAATHIVAVTDAEEEVRTALRLISEHLDKGVPLHRIAALYSIAQPYALLAHEQFEAAGVPHNGPSVRTLAQTLSGRTLLGLLRLREADFRREAVMDWLSAAPVLEEPNGRPAPAHRWDALSRAAGIVAGAGQWTDRLARHLRSLRGRLEAIERTDERDEWRARSIEIDIEHTQRLARFADDLVARSNARELTTWQDHARWGRELLDRYLGGEGHRAGWPDLELEAHRAVEEALDALSNLGDVRPHTDEATFRKAIERELEAPAGRFGRFGEGVFTGRIGDALGADFDVVILLGMTEGLVPPRERDDPLLPDNERSHAADLPLRTERHGEARRDYLAALASAKERVLVFPRADLRGQRGKLPAHWLLESASQLEGRPLFSTDLERLKRSWYTPVPSFEGALSAEGARASVQEYDLATLLRWGAAGRSVHDHYLLVAENALGSGLDAERSRQSDALTRWDGHVEGVAGLAPSAEQAVSPTALQHWASCPFRYFLGHVLRIAETEKPEETLALSPLDRGNLVHEALEQFVREARPRTSPDEPWSGEDRRLLIRIGERLCAEFEGRGVTGKALLWRLERARVLRDLAGFLDKDEELRRTHRVLPTDVELSFGLAGADEPAIVVPLDGRAVAFRGRIDRVDRAPDGSRLVVLDYKSGKLIEMYRKLDSDAVHRGRLLQLPVYGLAAQQRYGGEHIDAYYWFVTEQDGYEPRGFALDAARLDRFRDVLGTIVRGIGEGLFPARPGPPREGRPENCQICPFDRVCPRDRTRVWERKHRAPALREFVALTED